LATPFGTWVAKAITVSTSSQRKTVRDLYGAMHSEGAVRAIVITAGYFTDEARGLGSRQTYRALGCQSHRYLPARSNV
jgi:hypothetical protein